MARATRHFSAVSSAHCCAQSITSMDSISKFHKCPFSSAVPSHDVLLIDLSWALYPAENTALIPQIQHCKSAKTAMQGCRRPARTHLQTLLTVSIDTLRRCLFSPDHISNDALFIIRVASLQRLLCGGVGRGAAHRSWPAPRGPTPGP